MCHHLFELPIDIALLVLIGPLHPLREDELDALTPLLVPSNQPRGIRRVDVRARLVLILPHDRALRDTWRVGCGDTWRMGGGDTWRMLAPAAAGVAIGVDPE